MLTPEVKSATGLALLTTCGGLLIGLVKAWLIYFPRRQEQALETRQQNWGEMEDLLDQANRLLAEERAGRKADAEAARLLLGRRDASIDRLRSALRYHLRSWQEREPKVLLEDKSLYQEHLALLGTLD